MPVSIVVGGQYGSEGKGKVAHFLAAENKSCIAVRVGGCNSGHTIIDRLGNRLIFRHLPTASVLPDVICVLGAGSYIKPDILLTEISTTGLTPERLVIDPNAVIITAVEEEAERGGILRKTIGSTASGTGAAVRRRLDRDATVPLAKHDARLHPYVRPVTPFLREALNVNRRVIIEGTQGFGLSVLHSATYPFVTTRDTTASGFLSEVGLSPFDVDDIVMVLRTFPIRVGGNSGPLPNEIDWQILTTTSGSKEPLIEHTSVTKSVRRVATFDPILIRQALEVNRPTRIVLNHLDYVDVNCRNNNVSEKAREFIAEVETSIEATIDYVGTGPASLIHYERQLVKRNVAG
jgi:adenylosuccinate synthase